MMLFSAVIQSKRTDTNKFEMNVEIKKSLSRMCNVRE
jgi:hypothetical protein